MGDREVAKGGGASRFAPRAGVPGDGPRLRVTFVVPCFDEEHRLPTAALRQLLADTPELTLLFVDDGSRDGTREVLAALAVDESGRARALELGANRGKGEAVRVGMRAALADSTCDAVGYFDADMATSAPDLRRLIAQIHDPSLLGVVGSRVQLMGHVIERSTLRHYAGRVFATAASLVLKQPFYDTQCGAKLFRRSAILEASLADPFLTRWVFDVELLGRLLAGTVEVSPLAPTALRELPLYAWRDVPGSKVGAHHAIEAVVALARVRQDLGRRRARRPA